MTFSAGNVYQHMPDRRLIINADDFGYSHEINLAVVTSFSKGLCSSTTIMANMPGSEEACQFCHDNRLVERVGLHLVLTEGMPLTDEIKRCSRFCNSEGYFHSSSRRHFFSLSPEERNAVAQEASAQIDRFKKAGIPLIHLDSHRHIHTEWAIAGVLLHVARNRAVRYIRLARHLDPSSTRLKNLYRKFLNLRIRANGAAATQYFGTVEDFCYLERKTKNSMPSFEVMIHPAFSEKQILIDDLSKKPLDEYITVIEEYNHAVSYRHIADDRPSRRYRHQVIQA
jgi:predicted glycoside hydrolase/deacetylase ChbG (UPF0249 family)